MFLKAKSSVVLLAVGLMGSGAIPAQAAPVGDLSGFLRPSESLGRLEAAVRKIRSGQLVQRVLKNHPEQSFFPVARIDGDAASVETTKFQHYLKGVEVFGSMAFHHQGLAGSAVRERVAEIELDTQPTLSLEDATALAQSFAQGQGRLNGAPALKVLPNFRDGGARLVYWADFQSTPLAPGVEVIVDAHTGELVAELSKLHTVAPVDIYSAKNIGLSIVVHTSTGFLGRTKVTSCDLKDLGTGKVTTMEGSECLKMLQGQAPAPKFSCQVLLAEGSEATPLDIDLSSCAKVVEGSVASGQADDVAKRALSNSLKTLAYYQDRHGRDSFDDKGSASVNLVHVGLNFGNAAWIKDMNVMMYGDGDGKYLGDFTRGVDIAGHELAHGVTAHTAQLVMMGQSGALNEAYSDFFGKMIANDGHWQMGRDVVLSGFGAPAFRDLENPASIMDTVLDSRGQRIERPYPANAREEWTSGGPCGRSNDQCWVHHNATIPGHAAYLVTKAIGREKAEKLYYATLTRNISASEDFKGAAAATVSMCGQLFDATTCDQVKAVFTQVGML